MSLPISDLDNPHMKRGRRSSFGRLKLSTVLCVAVFLALMIFGISRTNLPNTYKDYLPQKAPSVSGVPASLECTRSFDGKKPVNQYVVMIDAGSSGSRVHVYQFNNCQRMPVLVNEEFKMKDGGLSSFDSDAAGAAKSLDSLLQVAIDAVPEELQKCTPVSVMATAGLRALGEEKSTKILDAVKERLESEYPFAVVHDGVKIMSGDDEGVYAWITANYLLGNIGTSEKTPTVAVFDLGGGSTQIVFEPTMKETLGEGDFRHELTFGGRDFVLYEHSYLGYGLNSAVDKMNTEIVKMQSVGGPKLQYVNPCLAPGSTFTTRARVPDGSTSRDGETLVQKEVTFVAPQVAAPLQCRAIAEKILEKDSVCANPPCSFGGVHQPRLLDAFPMDSDMYVFSYFYDRTAPLGMPSSFSVAELGQLAQLVCDGTAAYSAFEVFPGAVEQLKENPKWCAELTYMDALLRSGYELKGHRDVKIAKKINGNELGWCLGASLPLLDRTNWRCRP